MDEYFDHDQFDEEETDDCDNELYHYGVLGMKWGVRRAARKMAKNERLERKAAKYDVKSAKATRKSDDLHNALDLTKSNKALAKANKYAVKSAKLQKKALNKSNEYARARLEQKAAKAEFKSATKRVEANKLSKLSGYGSKAMKYSVKSDKLARKAAKTRLKMANNERYVAKMRQKVKDMPERETQLGQDYLAMLERGENQNGV